MGSSDPVAPSAGKRTLTEQLQPGAGAPTLDAIATYAAKIGAPYRHAQVRKLADRVSRTGDAEASQELIREERALVAEELALLRQIERDPSAREQFGEQTLATVADQTQHHAAQLAELGVEHALQSGLAEISPGKAWEGSSNQVEPALAEARAAGARIHHEQLGDGSRRHIVTAGAKRYAVYEHSSGPPPEAIREAAAQARVRVAELERRPRSKVNLPANPADARLLDAAQIAAGPDAPASRVLDELHRQMPPDQQHALDAFRRKMGDASALRAIEAIVPRQDLAQFLTEKLLSNPERARLQTELATARAELARARMAELGVAGDGFMQSKLREDASALLRNLAPDGSIDDSRVADAVKCWDVRGIVGDLGEAIGRAQLQANAASVPDRSVLSNVEIVTRVPGLGTIKEWQRAQRAHGQPDNPKGLYEADGKLWRSITEVDNLVVERTARGALRPVLMEQVKTGVDDRPGDAAKQNTKALDALKAAAMGSPDIAVYDRIGKNTLGAQRGGELDLSHLDALTLQTRGLPGKNLDPGLGDHFDAALDLGSTNMSAKEARSLLEDLARELLGAKVLELIKAAPGAGK